MHRRIVAMVFSFVLWILSIIIMLILFIGENVPENIKGAIVPLIYIIPSIFVFLALWNLYKYLDEKYYSKRKIKEGVKKCLYVKF